MYKKQIIQDHQIGLLRDRAGFKRILVPGTHYLRLSQNAQLFDLTEFPANVPNLEWLVTAHAGEISDHLEVIRTGMEEVVMVCSGQQRHFVLPNTLQAFWKKGLPLEIHRTAIGKDLKVPAEWIANLAAGVSISCVKQFSVPPAAYGMLFVEETFCDLLSTGRHAYFDVHPKTRLTIIRQTQVLDNKDVVRSILAGNHPEIFEHFTSLTTSYKELAAWWDHDELVHLSHAATQSLASNALNAERISLEQSPRNVEPHFVRAMRTNALAASLLAPYTASYEVPSEHIGMLHVDGVLSDTLRPGFYCYWHGGKRLSLTTIDTRLMSLEISGQEILTQDKVPLRVNVTAGYRIVDAALATSNLSDYKDFIYKEIQFALRAAIGSRTLDGLLENKNETDKQVMDYMQQKVAAQGIQIVSLGIKDLILPGEIKTMLGRVVEAEKAAQANVIRRREETAATRSLMNTSKVMEDNPVALRLKELETLEKITEKIDRINVYGGLEGLLKQLSPFKIGSS